MKKTFLLLLLCAAMLLSCVSCSKEKYDLLSSTTQGTMTFDVRGKSGKAKQIVVKDNGNIIWTEKLDLDSSVTTLGAACGFVASDLNFDGALDIQIAQSVAGDCVSYLCWLWDAESASYLPCEALNGLYNVMADAERKCVFVFDQKIEREQYADASISTNTTDFTTQYVWAGGILTPKMRLSLTYYSKRDVYQASVAYYNAATGEFEIDNTQERWLRTDEELAEYDTSALYYFK